MAKVIDPLWAIIAKDENEDGDEGIPAILIEGMFMPLFGADAERVGWLKDQAQEIATETGQNMKLVCFQERIDLETFTP